MLTGAVDMKLKQRGALIVEYVLILPLMIFLIFTSVYLGMVFHDFNAVNEVAREAARYGVVGNTDAAIKTAALARCNDLLTKLYATSAEDITVTRAEDSALNSEKYLEVSISARKVPEHSMGMIDEFLPNTLSAKVRMRIELEPEDIKP